MTDTDEIAKKISFFRLAKEENVLRLEARIKR
jgi:hypothetical protein